ncbi:DUF5819 family protein [Streptomyces sp. BI20]|uniref:DUF5819 family protein n=1 Tax=Streptomyces sp. BI20 TaxID=3403460 RepID=UPI003C775858
MAGIRGLPAPHRVLVALVLGLVTAGALAHLGFVFLHVAPANTLGKRNGAMVDAWIYPEFEQNWKLFAPNPLQQNVAVEARAQLRAPGGETITSDWLDLTAQDIADLRGNPFPSHTTQNELRRAWDFFTGSHGEDDRPQGERGELAELYLQRIAVNRLLAAHPDADVLRVQLRSATRAVPAPSWSEERTDTQTHYRELPWWTV